MTAWAWITRFPESAELGILGAIIALRGLLTFLIHWEIKNEQKALDRKQQEAEG